MEEFFWPMPRGYRPVGYVSVKLYCAAGSKNSIHRPTDARFIISTNLRDVFSRQVSMRRKEALNMPKKGSIVLPSLLGSAPRTT